MKELVLIAQANASSGLALQLKDGLTKAGTAVRMVDCRAKAIHKIWPALKCFHPDRKTWLRRRWESGIFSVDAWRRNTRINGKLLQKAGGDKLPILQVGGNYFPHPGYREMTYNLFITYPMILCYRDKIKPWVPPVKDRDAYLELEKDLYQHAAHIFVNAAYVRKSLESDYSVRRERITVTGLGVDDYFLKHKPDDIPASFTHNILFVGYDFGYKGGHDLLEAFKQAKKIIPGLTLTVVGPDSSQIPATEGVRVLGRVQEKSNLLSLYRDADLFAMPSLCDSFGFVFLEAMSQGVPCIGTNLNAMPEIIQNGITGYIVPLRDSAAIASAILTFYQTPTTRKQMGHAAVNAINSHYTWKRVTAMLQETM